MVLEQIGIELNKYTLVLGGAGGILLLSSVTQRWHEYRVRQYLRDIRDASIITMSKTGKGRKPK